jgi:hypothetical protein
VRIFLNFASRQNDVHRARVSYAFRVFCAIFGHEPILGAAEATSADAWIDYSRDGHGSRRGRTLRLGNYYVPRPVGTPAPPPIPFERDGEKTVLFYGNDAGPDPDWLSEIFEWLSCADEYSVTSRDSVGRVPFKHSYVGRHGLDVGVPYAAIAMQFLQRALCKLVPATPERPMCPAPSVRHLVINTHDVDFLPVSYLSSLRRLAKYAAISLLMYRKPALAINQVGKAVAMMIGTRNPLDQVTELANGEACRSVKGSYYFLTRHAHRRDGNYAIDQAYVLEVMRFLQERGMEIGVHGSYTSLDEPTRLADEFDRMRNRGFQPIGGRQHWLRFTLDRLIPAVNCTGAIYDASLGWSERPGFRAGACFAFPLYDFTRECASGFLQIPLVVMEQSLRTSQNGPKDWYNQVAALLTESRKYGWGGISLLWHPTAFGGGQLPLEMANVFWLAMNRREQWTDTWVSGEAFVNLVRRRYLECGLFPAAESAAHIA